MLPVRLGNRLAAWDTRDDFDRLFNAAFGGAPSLSGWSPAVDVAETADEFVLTAELPGMAGDDVEVSVEAGVLTISGEKRDTWQGNGETTRHIVERRFGRFLRNFSLPRTVDAEKVEASFEHGLLRITLPKAVEAKARKIKIG